MLIVRIRIVPSKSKKGTRIGILILLLVTIILTPKTLGSEITPIRREVHMPAIVEDWQWIIQTIIQEAATESFKGKVMIAEVIRDRAETRYNSDGTIVDTILRARQFSGWNTEESSLRIRVAKLDLSEQVVQDAIKAYNLAFKGRSSFAMGANLYHADYMNPYPSWTEAENVVRLTHEGHHIFYKETR